jgi:probable rRNA maturation factor
VITFNYQTDFILDNQSQISDWIEEIMILEGYQMGDINYVFCDDSYLNKMNVEFLNHDTYTDIISFDYSLGKQLHGDIYISVERVIENAQIYQSSFKNELCRVMIHGILHYMGFKDKTNDQQKEMTEKENQCLLKLNH